LSIDSPGEICTRDAFVVSGATCSEIPKVEQFMNETATEINLPQLLYLLPGSIITLLDVPSDTQVYIVKTIDTNRKFSSNGLGSSLIQCNSELENIECFSPADGTFSYNITEPNFYSVQFQPPKFSIQYTLMNVSYNLTAIRENFEVQEFLVSSTEKQVNVLSSFFDFRSKCVLLLGDCPTGMSHNVAYSNIKQRSDILVLIAIVILLLCIVFIIVICVLHIVHVFKY